MIPLPENLSPEIKRQIKKSYNATIRVCGDSETEYVHRKFPSFARRLDRTRGHKKSLVEASKLLYKVYFGERQLSRPLNSKTKKEVISALFYVVNPFDVIPDFTPGTGYIDDCFVINLCLTKIKSSNPFLYRLAERRILGDSS
tara:strand:- start:4182 stop:4610 length:429 start_codon:yes stop_codon:yes gene_type:complete